MSLDMSSGRGPLHNVHGVVASPDPRPGSSMKDAWRHFAAEFIGTFALVFIGGGAIITSPSIKCRPAVVLNIALAHGLILALLVTATMRISGHLNPAVTAGFLVDAPHRADDGRRLLDRAVPRRDRSRRTRSRRSIPASVAMATRLGGQSISADVTLLQAIVARGDRDVLPRLRRLRHGGRSARAEGRRLRDRTHGHGRHPRDRAAHRRRR